jgi:hypothetical protein
VRAAACEWRRGARQTQLVFCLARNRHQPEEPSEPWLKGAYSNEALWETTDIRISSVTFLGKAIFGFGGGSQTGLRNWNHRKNKEPFRNLAVKPCKTLQLDCLLIREGESQSL